MNVSVTERQKAEARAWLAKVVRRERDSLQARAYEAGMALGLDGLRAEDGRIVGWWPALAPLKAEERETVRHAVAMSLVEEAEALPVDPAALSAREHACVAAVAESVLARAEKEGLA